MRRGIIVVAAALGVLASTLALPSCRAGAIQGICTDGSCTGGSGVQPGPSSGGPLIPPSTPPSNTPPPSNPPPSNTPPPSNPPPSNTPPPSNPPPSNTPPPSGKPGAGDGNPFNSGGGETPAPTPPAPPAGAPPPTPQTPTASAGQSGGNIGAQGGSSQIGGRGQAAPTPVTGRVLGEVDTSNGVGSSGFSRTGAEMEAFLKGAGLPNAPQRPVDQKEIQEFLAKRVGQMAGMLDADQMAKKAAHDKLLSLALGKIGMRDWRAALRDLDLLLTNDPYDPLALEKRSEAENHLAKYQESELDARKALALDPNSAAAWQQLAWSLLKQGRYREALEAINRALALDPGNANDYAIRAYIKSALGDRAGALEDLEKAALLDSHYRAMLDAARQGGRIYAPDDENATAEMISKVKDAAARWPLVAAAVALLLLSGLGVAAYRTYKNPTVRKVAAALTPWKPKPVFLPKSGGTMIGKYELGRMIGKGGMGEVYAATDLSLGRPVAVKKLSVPLPELGAEGRKLLLKEAKMVASLHHPSIVDIYEILEHGDDVFLVFEFVNGKTIHQLLAEKGRLTPAQALAILKPVCRALSFAHAHDLVHRDLKPANIMITEDGHVKLMDFGIARSLSDAGPSKIGSGPQADPFARTRTVMGTPGYMSPESDMGIVSRRGDVYSLGVSLYEMVTGRRPFGADVGTLQDKLEQRYEKPSKLVPNLTSELDALIKDTLQPDPERRLQTTIEFLARLKAVVGEKATPYF